MDYLKQGFRLSTLRERGLSEATSRSRRRAISTSSVLASGGAGPTFTRGISIGPVPVSGPGCGPSGEQEHQRGEN
jgi:hypothetical protein